MPVPEEPAYQRLVIPTDGSKTSQQALEKGVQLARAMDAHVTGLYVIDNSAYAAFPGDIEWSQIKDMLAKESEKALGMVEEACKQAGIDCNVHVREGNPAEEIIAASKDYDLIIMGTHGRSGLEHLLLGSVAEKVIRHADKPVLVVREPDEE